MNDTAPVAARERLLAWINASWSTQAIAAAVRLGVAEALGEQPQEIGTLAQRCRCDAPALQRLLRALVTLELAVESEAAYAAGPLTPVLRAGAPDSLAAWAEFCAGRSWESWARLPDCVRAGASARELEGGRAGLAHLDADAAAADLFNRAMASVSAAVAGALADRLPLAAVTCVVDVGGGAGHVLAAMLLKHSAPRGVVFDRPHVAAAARETLARAGLAERCVFVPGDFFQGVPAGADLYLLKSVLHNWDDAAALAILRRCRDARAADGWICLAERLLPERLAPTPTHRAMVRSDLNMLVGPGGRERTLSEYETLLQGAGLQLRSTTDLAEGYALLQAR